MNSRHTSCNSHPAIPILRISTIISSILCVVVFAWVFKAHNKVYTDGAGAYFTLFPLIFTAYALVWSLLILAIRGFYSAFIHPAIYITFGLIAFGTILGCCAAKLHFVTSYGSQYSCDRRYSGTCNIYSMQLRVMEYFGCVVGILDSVLYFGLFVWACSVCSKRVRGVQKG